MPSASKKDPDVSRFFESAVAALLQENIRSHVAKKLPNQPELHDAIVNDTIVSLWKHLLKNPQIAKYFLSLDSDDQSTLDNSHLLLLTKRIANHRIVDQLKLSWRYWSKHLNIEDTTDLHHKTTETAEDELNWSQILSTCLKLIGTLNDSDRELLIKVTNRDKLEPTLPLTPAERKRISRLRRHLKFALESEIGTSSEELF